MYINLQNAIDDLVRNLLHYDRKDDEDLPIGSIEKMIRARPELANEILARFRLELTKGLDQ